MDRNPKVWSLQDAKARLSEVINRVEKGEEQVITRHGRQVARVVPMQGSVPESGDNESFADFMNRSPLRGSGLKIPPRGKISLKMRKLGY